MRVSDHFVELALKGLKNILIDVVWFLVAFFLFHHGSQSLGKQWIQAFSSDVKKKKAGRECFWPEEIINDFIWHWKRNFFYQMLRI